METAAASPPSQSNPPLPSTPVVVVNPADMKKRGRKNKAVAFANEAFGTSAIKKAKISKRAPGGKFVKSGGMLGPTNAKRMLAVGALAAGLMYLGSKKMTGRTWPNGSAASPDDPVSIAPPAFDTRPSEQLLHPEPTRSAYEGLF